jgi:hypothetical protein|tara:strand:- start:156 stop:329 length:174 start_codon:yes stop_codon:yes gene_type:complete
MINKFAFGAGAFVAAFLFLGLVFDAIDREQEMAQQAALDWQECGQPCSPIDPPVRNK